MTYKDGEPCDRPGCLNHVTHPCEGCGRTAGRSVDAGGVLFLSRTAIDHGDVLIEYDHAMPIEERFQVSIDDGYRTIGVGATLVGALCAASDTLEEWDLDG